MNSLNNEKKVEKEENDFNSNLKADSAQESVENSNDPSNHPTSTHSDKKSNKFLVILLVISLILCFSVISVLLFLNSASDKTAETIRDYIVAGEFEKAKQSIRASIGEFNIESKVEAVIEDEYYNFISTRDIENAAKMFNSLCVYFLDKNVLSSMLSDAKSDINHLKENYVNKSFSYDRVTADLDFYSLYDDSDIQELCSENKKYITTLYTSRENFDIATAYDTENNYDLAIITYRRVNIIDENYEVSQSRITELLSIFRTKSIEDATTLQTEMKFGEAISVLKHYLDISGKHDEEISSFVETLTNQKYDYDKKTAFDSQQVIVTKVYKDAKMITINTGFSVVFKNLSDKVVKDISVSILSYDTNGYPLNFSFSKYQDSNNVVSCQASTINLVPGSTKSAFWDSFHSDAVKASACVKSVTFMDGTVWNNDYHSYWVEENKNRYVG